MIKYVISGRVLAQPTVSSDAVRLGTLAGRIAGLCSAADKELPTRMYVGQRQKQG